MRVLVTDGDTRAALAVTRALGRRGHTVIVAEKRAPAFAHTSRYCARAVVYPDPAADATAFLVAIRALVEEHRVDVLFPVADVVMALVTQGAATLPPSCRMPCPDAAVIARAADKVDMVRTAERLGVPVPRSIVVGGPGEATGIDLPYPVVLKPHRSRVKTSSGWLGCTVSYAGSPEDLARQLARKDAAEFPILLQERITGPGMGVFLCFDRGRPVASFSHRRLREKPPWGGVSVLSESRPVPARAGDYAERLLKELQWHGVAMVEFKVDERVDEPMLMEINGRFWGSLQLAIDAGVDFPNLLLDVAEGRTSGEAPTYRSGVKSRWFWGDVDALLLRLFATPPDGVARGGRLEAVWQFSKLWGSNLYYENPKAYSLRPWLHETRQWFGQSR